MNQVPQDEGPSGLSIAALVTGILSMGVIPIILGSIDLVRIGSGLSSARGKGLDIESVFSRRLGQQFGSNHGTMTTMTLKHNLFHIRLLCLNGKR